MSSRILSSETVHASTVASDGRAVLISGPSGSGKSDLALRLLDRGFTLVSDDQTIVRRDGDRLVASAPPTIKGKLEIRGIGIVEMDTVNDVPVALFVELTSEIMRLPDDRRERPGPRRESAVGQRRCLDRVGGVQGCARSRPPRAEALTQRRCPPAVPRLASCS